MHIQPPDYDQVERELWKKHASEVLDLLKLRDKGLMRRIQTFSQRFGFEIIDICQKIEDDYMFACCFAKDAKKTGFEEKEAEKYLRMFPDTIRSFKVLPKSGKNALYIGPQGDIITGKKQTGTKSLDFLWRAGNTSITCVAAHKVTREKGGAQDHQRNELITLLQFFQHSKDMEVVLFVICDGAYYDERTLSILREYVRSETPF